MKTNLDKFFKVKDDYVSGGVWFMLDDKTGFRLAAFRPTNPRMRAVMAKFYAPVARQMDKKTLSEEKQNELNLKIFVHGCMLDWKGVEIDGVDTPFDVETAIEFLRGLPELADTLNNYASDFTNYKEELDAEELEDVGNS